MKFLEVQIGQLEITINAQQKRNFSSDMEMNPKEHCNALTLRSGKEVENPKIHEE